MVREDKLWVEAPGVIRGVLWGTVPNKSNRRRLFRVGGRPMFAKSIEAVDLEEKFKVVVLASCLGRTRLVGATSERDLKKGLPILYLQAHVYGDFIRDLDLELLPDLLQKNGLINNDRAIRRKRYDWSLAKGDLQRVEFEIGIERTAP